MLAEGKLAEFVTNELLGKPFKHGADGPNAYDCYGIVRAVQWNGFGIWMPTIDRVDINPHGLARRLMDPDTREEWIEVNEGRAKHGDIVVMGNVDGRDYHMGVRLRIGQQVLCIHTDEKTGCVVEDIATLPIKGYHKIRYFRHKSKA